ncbi:hypothetical protein LZ32DRAFT_535645 [Colletotrichum eremochloae]|nr:hypothetical protein LZ32DRAFT_535645 [Colletotrichum eremochloae]
MEGKDTNPRQRKTFESRIQDAFQNGMTPEFFRWAMQTDIDAPQQQSLAQQQQQQHQEQQQLRRTRAINISDDESQEGQQGPTAADLEAWRADALPCFAPLEWLNDNAVSLLIKEVVKKSQDCGPPQQRNGSDCGLHVIRNADLATCAPGVDFPNIPLESGEIRSYYRRILEEMTLN